VKETSINTLLNNLTPVLANTHKAQSSMRRVQVKFHSIKDYQINISQENYGFYSMSGNQFFLSFLSFIWKLLWPQAGKKP